MLGGRRKREGEGRKDGGRKGGKREKKRGEGEETQPAPLNFHPVEHSLLACMCYFLVNNYHLNLSPANNFCSDIYTIGYSTPVLSALNAFQARECAVNYAVNSAVNSALRSKAATAG